VPKVSEEHVQARRGQILQGARRTFARHRSSAPSRTGSRSRNSLGLELDVDALLKLVHGGIDPQ